MPDAMESLPVQDQQPPFWAAGKWRDQTSIPTSTQLSERRIAYFQAFLRPDPTNVAGGNIYKYCLT